MTGPRLKPEEMQEIENLTAEGMSAKKIGKRLKRSPHTIQKHIVQPDVQLRLADKFDVVAEKALDSINEEDYTKASLVQKTTAAAIAIDKRQLLKGHPTSINVTVIWEAVQAIRDMRAAQDAEQFPRPTKALPAVEVIPPAKPEKAPAKTGPKPEALKIEGKREDTVRKSLEKKKPLADGPRANS